MKGIRIGIIAFASALALIALSATSGAQSASTLIFEENFTSDNSPTGQTAPTIAQVSARGWRDGIAGIGTAYKFEVDPLLKKNVMFVHWSTLTAGDSDPKGPDGGASGWKKFFTGTRDATMYALVKFHHVENAPHGAHWIRFFNSPSFGDNSPANADGQMDLDVSSSVAGGEGQGNQLYDPTTKAPISYQHSGLFLYSGGSLGYASTGKDGVWKDDTWYEVVWYLKASTTGSGPRGAGDGQMRVVLRPYGTAAWVTAFDGQNFVTSALTAPISTWMIGPYMDRWTTDIRHYFSRIAVWTGDAYTNGTLAAFLGTNTPPPTPTTCTDPAATNVGQPLPCTYPPVPPADTTPPVLTFTSPTGSTVTQGVPVQVAITATPSEPLSAMLFTVNGVPATSPYTFTTIGSSTISAKAKDTAGNEGTVTKTVSVVAAPPTPVPTPCTFRFEWKVSASSSTAAGAKATATITRVIETAATNGGGCPTSGQFIK